MPDRLPELPTGILLPPLLPLLALPPPPLLTSPAGGTAIGPLRPPGPPRRPGALRAVRGVALLRLLWAAVATRCGIAVGGGALPRPFPASHAALLGAGGPVRPGGPLRAGGQQAGFLLQKKGNYGFDNTKLEQKQFSYKVFNWENVKILNTL